MPATFDLIQNMMTLAYADRILELPVLQRKEPRQIDG
jgi:hypothetical protein